MMLTQSQAKAWEYFRDRFDRERRQLETWLGLLRARVKAATPPLPQDLVDAVIALDRRDFMRVMEVHPGYPASIKRRAHREALRTFELSAAAVLACADRLQNLARNEGIVVAMRSVPTGGLDEEMRKELFSFANAAHSLAEHGRNLKRKYELT